MVGGSTIFRRIIFIILFVVFLVAIITTRSAGGNTNAGLRLIRSTSYDGESIQRIKIAGEELAIAGDNDETRFTDSSAELSSIYSSSYNLAIQAQNGTQWKSEAENGCPNAYIPSWLSSDKITSVSTDSEGKTSLVFSDGNTLLYTDSVATTFVTTGDKTQALASDRIVAIRSNNQPFHTYRTALESELESPTITVGLLVNNFADLAARGLKDSDVNKIKQALQAAGQEAISALPNDAFSVSYDNPEAVREQIVVSDYEGNVVTTNTATATDDETATLISFEIPVEETETGSFATFNMSWTALFSFPGTTTFPVSQGTDVSLNTPKTVATIVARNESGESNPLIDVDGGFKLSNCVRVLEVSLFQTDASS